MSAAKASELERLEDQEASRAEPVHLAWTDDLLFALAAQVEVQTLCGLWTAPWDPHGKFVEEIGGLMPLYEQRDCSLCVSVHERNAARRWDRGMGGGR